MTESFIHTVASSRPLEKLRRRRCFLGSCKGFLTHFQELQNV